MTAEIWYGFGNHTLHRFRQIEPKMVYGSVSLTDGRKQDDYQEIDEPKQSEETCWKAFEHNPSNINFMLNLSENFLKKIVDYDIKNKKTYLNNCDNVPESVVKYIIDKDYQKEFISWTPKNLTKDIIMYGISKTGVRPQTSFESDFEETYPILAKTLYCNNKYMNLATSTTKDLNKILSMPNVRQIIITWKEANKILLVINNMFDISDLSQDTIDWFITEFVKYNPMKLDEISQLLRKADDKVLLNLAKYNAIIYRFVKDMPESIQMKLVKKNPYNIRYIQHPSDNVKQFVMANNADVQNYIKG